MSWENKLIYDNTLHPVSAAEQQQQAQTLLDVILGLADSDQIDERAVHEATREAEGLATASLKSLLHGQQQRKQQPITMTTLLLSDIYASLQAHRDAVSKSNRGNNGPQVWVAPATFERRTHKYWVEENQLPALLLLASTKAPLLVYGASGLLAAHHKNVPAAELFSHVAVPVSSIYFDSPDLGLYHTRIKREEGSRLLRVRWYGKHMPRGDATLFLELKTHHEGWVSDKSVKERVAIAEKHMPSFLSLQPWTEDMARRIVTAASPDQDDGKREKAVQLILTMKELVIQWNLRPCVRSVYERVSLQSANSNALRMTVDRNVTLFDETNSDRNGMMRTSSSCCPSWCQSEKNLGTGRTYPYSILEIKVGAAADNATTTPDDFGQTWLDSGLIMDAAKFSKFQTGAVAYNREKISILPYWTAHPSFATFLGDGLPTRQNRDMTAHTMTSISSSDTSMRMLTNESFHACNTETSASSPGPLVRRKSPPSTSPSCRPDTRSSRLLSLLPSIGSRPAASTCKIAPPKPARVEPKTYFANERTFIQWMSGAFLMVTVSTILFDMGGGFGGDGKDGQQAASQGIATGLLAFGGIVCCYAVYVYYRRLRMLEARQPFGYQDRHGPVLLATALLIGIVMLLWYYSDAFIASSTSSPGGRPVLRSDGRLCTQHDLRGVHMLQYQPSDVLPISNRPDVMLVPSVSQITSVSIVKKQDGSIAFTNVLVLADVAEADMEAITQVGERIFAVSEDGKKKSTLLEFRWNDENDRTTANTLELVSSVKIVSPLVEGLAFVDGDLYVAGNRLDEQTGLTVGSIDVYPDFVDSWANANKENNTDTTMSGHRLNSKLLDHGLTDSKIGALYYFEGILYILYDNAQLVRGWHLGTSEQVLEWVLPSVPVTDAAASSSSSSSPGTAHDPHFVFDYDKQWEGLALERVGQTKNSDGTAENDGRLMLHLTLDSPPQLWSLQLFETPDTRSPSFPECASRP